MKILHVSAELAPLAKVGGLGDMVFGLTRAQKALGHTVQTVLPKYNHITFDRYPDVFLIDDPVFKGKAIYGGEDENERFITFCKKAAPVIEREKPDILQLHDWHTCLLTQMNLPGKHILTVNNFAHQGETTSIPGYENLLLAGIENAQQVTTVSPSYLTEILEENPSLEKHRGKMHGILNGIDYAYWNPETDPYAIKKEALCEEFQLDPKRPLFAAISRLVPQKGPEMIASGARFLIEKGASFILVGSYFGKEMETLFTNLQKELEPTGHARFFFGYDEPLSHKVFSGADALFVPSIFEPCGLTQMIAMRYGTIPVVRATGGLKDTVFEGKNGFTFVSPDESNEALSRALDTLTHHPEKWNEMITTGQNTDFSWKHSAREYDRVYAT